MDKFDPKLLDLLLRDPLAEAEDITGRSYKDDDVTMSFGLVKLTELNRLKTTALREHYDTYYGMSFVEALHVFESMGFEVVLPALFEAPDSLGDHARYTERFFILWHTEGVLATIESYMEIGLNTSKVYYNVKPHKPQEIPWEFRSSGHWTGHGAGRAPSDAVWVGDHDGREGIRNALAGLASVGDFLPVWKQKPFLWLLTYDEERHLPKAFGDKTHERINQKRIAQLPQHVQDAINGKEQ